MELPKRKPNRLQNYDYSSNGAYFITICTHNHRNMFWNYVGANCVRQQKLPLSDLGMIVDNEIQKWNLLYESVDIAKYVIMPNHIHLIIIISSNVDRRTQFAPTISRMVKQFKGAISKQVGYTIWQKSYHDHIIRDEQDYLKIWNYINTNPEKWKQDRYYT